MEVGGEIHGNTGLLAVGRYRFHGRRDALGGVALTVGAEAHGAVVEMVNGARTCLVGADEAEATEDGAIRRQQLRQLRFHAKAVLQGDQQATLAQPRRQQAAEQMVCRGFERNDHHVANRNRCWRLMHMHLRQRKVAVYRVDAQAVPLHMGVITAQQKMHLEAGLLELCSVIATNGSCTKDGITHSVQQSGEASLPSWQPRRPP